MNPFMIHEYPNLYLLCTSSCFVLIFISMYMHVLCLYLYVFAGIGMYYNNMSEKWLSTKTRIGLYLHV